MVLWCPLMLHKVMLAQSLPVGIISLHKSMEAIWSGRHCFPIIPLRQTLQIATPESQHDLERTEERGGGRGEQGPRGSNNNAHMAHYSQLAGEMKGECMTQRYCHLSAPKQSISTKPYLWQLELDIGNAKAVLLTRNIPWHDWKKKIRWWFKLS